MDPCNPSGQWDPYQWDPLDLSHLFGLWGLLGPWGRFPMDPWDLWGPSHPLGQYSKGPFDLYHPFGPWGPLFESGRMDPLDP